MRLFSDKTREARQALIEARQTLADVSAGEKDVTDAYLDANDAVIQAEEPLKWWRRLDIDTDLHTREPNDTDEF